MKDSSPHAQLSCPALRSELCDDVEVPFEAIKSFHSKQIKLKSKSLSEKIRFDHQSTSGEKNIQKPVKPAIYE